ncbi:MAG: hypothetical protein ACI8QC_002831 [Planctomycetota bacterium]|jgi:hypothetical protein
MSSTAFVPDPELDGYPRFEFTLDRAHLEEHWEELVAVSLPNLRGVRRMGRQANCVGGLCIAVGVFIPTFGIVPICVGIALIGTSFIQGIEVRRKHRGWLRQASSSHRFGQRVQMVIRDGAMVQVPAAIQGLTPAGEWSLVDTPRGYFMRVAHAEELDFGPDFAQASSIYLPHRTLSPSMDREALRALVRP